MPELSSELDHWEVTLTSGEIVHLRAHGVKEDTDTWVFVALVQGSPAREYEIVCFPRSAVRNVEGGWPEPRT